MTSTTQQLAHQLTLHSLRQETPDVWTLNCHSSTPFDYLPGQFVLVEVPHQQLRAYTLSSSPGISAHLQLTIRHLPEGRGSTWLTQSLRPGDALSVSGAQGRFTPQHAQGQAYLFLAAGSGVTPIMSMTRWLLKHSPDCHLVVIYHVRRASDVIFREEWQALAERYPAQLSLHILVREDNRAGTALSTELLQTLVPDLTRRTVMTCASTSYMDTARSLLRTLGVADRQIHQEAFFVPQAAAPNEAAAETCQIRIQPWGDLVTTPKGGNLMSALETAGIPLMAACRQGDCGSCKVKALSGKGQMGSQTALGQAELDAGWLLACCCTVDGDLEISLL
ncbi:2Fe-2S iron-sulfur cluster-binding protein [Paludibacterium sp. B53371]|uniref:2Fe-2S iron-sulfur cluster-binding protein n=1 Tax=Paludibacterium sp. B53371 TaxID=2806263 RepID=UPI001C054063|nr:2Fe-2S iron-sulfur cluster-binding protein [Paludibacterium sp. B53371]